MIRPTTGTLMAMVLVLALPAGAQEADVRPERGEAPRPEAPKHPDGMYMGRPIADVMSYLGADWLLRPSRVAEERPDDMLDALHIEPGQTVADIGAGVGYTSLKLARRVGEDGKVYAVDIQPEMLRMLRKRVAKTRYKSVIVPVLSTPTDPRLPEGAVDLAIMVDVYHEFSDPEAMLQALRRALKPGGRIVFVEYRAEDPTVPIKPEHKMTLEQVRREVEPQGFAFDDSLEFLPWQHVILFHKPADAAPDGDAAPDAGDREGPATTEDSDAAEPGPVRDAGPGGRR